MEEVLKSDVFFFITSTAVVVLSLVLLVALYYLIKILRDVKDISHTVKRESELILSDVDAVRRSIKKKSKQVGAFISRAASSHLKRKAKHKKH